MNISYRWLKEVMDVDLPADQVAAVLTATGLEVEGVEEVEDVPGGLRGLVVGQILSAERHPDADRLQVCSVDIGADAPLGIVCGAANARAGLTVVVATVGATLHPVAGDPFTIKKGKIRGQVSMGMICAEDEIGVGSSHDGIIELPDTWAPGTPAAEVYGVGSDHVFTIGLTPNRTDGMSHLGVARDLRAGLLHGTVEGIEAQGLELNVPTGAALEAAGAHPKVALSVEAPDGAPRYLGLVIEGVQVGDAPKEVRQRLEAIGVGSINNVVDATNWVLHELGTPLHAFDLDQMRGAQVVVRRARAGEQLTTLDGVERTLDPADLVIADAEGPRCLAGVFGGAESGVSEGTTRVFLESAWFEPVSVRKTAKRHGLSTDASFRFERGVDPASTHRAMERAAALICAWSGGQVVGGYVHAEGTGLPGDAEIVLEWAALDGLIGMAIERDRVRSILASLDIRITAENPEGLTLQVPAYRSDVLRPADVIEEVLRIHGFDHVPLPKRMSSTAEIARGIDRETPRTRIAHTLVSRGFHEVMNNSLTRKAYADELHAATGDAAIVPGEGIAILNPLSQDLGVMRQTLLLQGLENIARNRNVQRKDMRLFELGRTYAQREGFEETEWLALWMVGRKAPEGWNNGKEDADFFALRGELEAVFDALGVADALTMERGAEGLLVGGVHWTLNGQTIGRAGALHPAALRATDVDVPVYAAEVQLEPLMRWVAGRRIKAEELPKFPAVRRDLAFVIDREVAFSDIADIARKTERKLLRDVQLFDVYEGDKLPADKLSYAISLRLQDPNKTLTDKQIDKTVDRIRQAIEQATGAQLR